MSRATYQEPVRRSALLPAFTQSLAEVHFHPHADFATLNVFTCERLNSVLTKEACAANYTRSSAPLSCKGCPIGWAHADGLNYRDESDRHAKAEAAHGLSCIRCERNEHTATKYIARFRLTRKHTLCVNCFNREREVVRGYNAKGATPVRWAHLQQATITIEDAAGEWKTLDIGLRSGRAECERYVTRIHPGCVIVECFMSGEALQPGDKTPTLSALAREAGLNPATARSRMKKYGTLDAPKPRKATAQPLAAPSAEDDESYRQSFEEPALDPESIAAYWDFSAEGLPEFTEWLLADDAIAPQEPSTPVADTSASIETEQPVTGDSEWAGVIVRDGRGVEYDIAKAAAQFEVAPDKIASEFGIPSNADMVFAGKTLGEWAERTGESVAIMASRMVETGSPFAPAPKAVRPPPTVPVTVAPVEIAEPTESDSEQSEHESEWAGCSITIDGVTTYVCDYAKERGISDEEAAIVLGMCDPEYADEAEAAATPEPEPAPEPVKTEPAPIPKKLTGKQLRKLEKAQRRVERHAVAPAQDKPTIGKSPRAIAITARAVVQIAFELNGFKA